MGEILFPVQSKGHPETHEESKSQSSQSPEYYDQVDPLE